MTEHVDQLDRVPDQDDEPTRGKARLSKAERLEAKAARLRVAAAERADGAQRPARPWIISTLALGVVGGLLIAAVSIGVPWIQHQRGINSARAGALKAAKAYAVDFGSYDYRHLDADFKKVASHLTPSFAAKYLKSSDGLKPTIVQYHGQSSASVQGAGISAVTTSSATVIVFLDQTITTSQSTTKRTDRNRVQMTLVRRHGTWLIENLLLE